MQNFMYLAIGVAALLVAVAVGFLVLRVTVTLSVVERMLLLTLEELRATLPEVRGSLVNVNGILGSVNHSLETVLGGIGRAAALVVDTGRKLGTNVGDRLGRLGLRKRS